MKLGIFAIAMVLLAPGASAASLPGCSLKPISRFCEPPTEIPTPSVPPVPGVDPGRTPGVPTIPTLPPTLPGIPAPQLPNPLLPQVPGVPQPVLPGPTIPGIPAPDPGRLPPLPTPPTLPSVGSLTTGTCDRIPDNGFVTLHC